MDGYQALNLEQLQTVEGAAKLNDMILDLFNMGQRATFLYSLVASTSADAYAKWGETTATSTIGIPMSGSGSIIHHALLMNVTTATSGDVTGEVRINDTNQSAGEVEINSSLGTGVQKNQTLIKRHDITFAEGDLLQVHLNVTGTMTYASAIGFVEVLFDE